MKPLSEKMAEIVDKISFKKIPRKTVKKVKYYILDSISCGLGAATMNEAINIACLMEKIGNSGEASIFNRKKKLHPALASYTNSYMCNLLDFDDTYTSRSVGGHPGATIIPPSIAMGEKLDVSGKKLIEAVIAGYECSIRIARYYAPTSDRFEKITGINTWQVFSASAAVSKIMDLEINEIISAICIAGIGAPVPSVRKVGLQGITKMKNNFGLVGFNGTIAAILASEGFDGNKELFEGKNGFWAMAGSDQFEMEVTPLSSKWFIEDVSFKPYPFCRCTHATLDALEQIIAENSLEVEDIKKIDIHTFYDAVALDFFPDNLINSQQSLPFAIAKELLKYEEGYDWNNITVLHDENVKKIINKIRIYETEEANRLYKKEGIDSSKVVITLKSGVKLEKKIIGAKGCAEHPMTEEEILKKAYWLISKIIDIEKAHEIISSVMKLEELDDITEITANYSSY